MVSPVYQFWYALCVRVESCSPLLFFLVEKLATPSKQSDLVSINPYHNFSECQNQQTTFREERHHAANFLMNLRAVSPCHPNIHVSHTK